MDEIFEFFSIIGDLKSTYRYTRVGERNESSAEHSWRLALMVMALDFGVDKEKAIKIALVHDLPEAITGDIDAMRIAKGEVSKEEKEQGEIKAINEICKNYPEIKALWEEYNEASTKEARFVKALDKIETLLQIIEAGKETWDEPDFIYNYANKAVADFPELLPMLQVVKKKIKEL